MTFTAAIKNTNFDTQTTNGMTAYKNTADPIVDLFFAAGASRGKDIIPQFEAAFQADPFYTGRIALWLRDIRGGAGERQLFRNILLYMEANMPHKIMLYGLLPKVPEMGRWDDLLIFQDEEIRHFAYTMIEKALDEGNGLCAKWMPRKGPIAADLRRFLGLTPKEYRRKIVDLSKTVEQQMCAKQWNEINFEHVPSVASSRYQTAFFRNAKESYEAFREKLVKGTAKINAAAVYPYDIIKAINHGGDKKVSLAQWEALPNYVGDASVLPIVDVSGSMSCPAGGNPNVTCLDVALSLGLYLSDKNKGPFKDAILTFSTNPTLKVLTGDLLSKLTQLSRAEWQMSTNVEKAIEVVLEVAVKNSVPAEDMPKYLLLLSDMQFNQCTHVPNARAIQMIAQKYEAAGYDVPKVVFWNLNAHDNVPVRFDESGTALVSGFSPAIMKSVLAAKTFTPKDVMDETINNPRYDYR